MDPGELHTFVRATIAALERPPVALWFAQCPHLAEAEAVALVTHVVRSAPVEQWTIHSGNFSQWPADARAVYIAGVAALPPGRRRTESLCRLAEHLDEGLLREGFDGLLAEHSPRHEEHHGKIFSNAHLHEALLRRVPMAWKDEWCARQPREPNDLFAAEVLLRSQIDGWSDATVRRCWAEAIARRPGRVPEDLLWLADMLPPDLRAGALARVRACPDDGERLHYLVRFADSLTEHERIELIEQAWQYCAKGYESMIASDLTRIAPLLPAAPPALTSRCLEIALNLPTGFHRHAAVSGLLPALAADEQTLAVQALERITVEEGLWAREMTWEEFSIPALVRMLQAPAVLRAGYLRDSLAAALFVRADAATQEQALAPWLAMLAGMDAEDRTDSLVVLTPWLAVRTDGALPRAIYDDMLAPRRPCP
jgi:hypothetical protein